MNNNRFYWFNRSFNLKKCTELIANNPDQYLVQIDRKNIEAFYNSYLIENDDKEHRTFFPMMIDTEKAMAYDLNKIAICVSYYLVPWHHDEGFSFAASPDACLALYKAYHDQLSELWVYLILADDLVEYHIDYEYFLTPRPAPMTIVRYQIQCPSCGKIFQASADDVDFNTITCKKCNQNLAPFLVEDIDEQEVMVIVPMDDFNHLRQLVDDYTH